MEICTSVSESQRPGGACQGQFPTRGPERDHCEAVKLYPRCNGKPQNVGEARTEKLLPRKAAGKRSWPKTAIPFAAALELDGWGYPELLEPRCQTW